MARVLAQFRQIDWRKLAALAVILLVSLAATASVAHAHPDGTSDAAHCSLCLSAHNATASLAPVVQALPIALVQQYPCLPPLAAPAPRTNHARAYSSRPPPALLAFSA